MADAHKNFAASLVATAPSPATSGTSLVVTAADGAKFPAAPFNATVWPTAAQPTTANAEVVRVTNISTDTLTITRAQESSSARTVVVGDQIAATITAQTLTDVESATLGPNTPPNIITDPAYNGLLAATHWPPFCYANLVLSGGYVYLVKAYLPKPVTLAYHETFLGVAGATLTTAQNWGGVYNSSGTLIGKTADQTTAWQSSGAKKAALTAEAGQSLTLGGPGVWVHLAVLANGTTKPAVAVSSPLGQISNLNLTAAVSRSGFVGGGTATVLPSTLGTVTQGDSQLFMGVS